MRRCSFIATLLLLSVILSGSGCGASRHGAPSTACPGATCDELEPWLDVIALPMDEGRLMVVTADRGGEVRAGVVRPHQPWRPEELTLRPVAGDHAGPLAAALAGGELLLLYGRAAREEVVLARVPAEGGVASEETMAAGAPRAVSVTVDAGGRVWCAWIDADGAVQMRRRQNESWVDVASGLAAETGARLAMARAGRSVVLARASSAGVDLVTLGERVEPPRRLTQETAGSVALPPGARWVSWADATGVHVAPTGDAAGEPVTVDDGTRDGEPARRVGAALAATVSGPGELVLAYQDQTTGSLVTVDDVLGARRRAETSDEEFTRGFRIAVAHVAGAPLVLDVGARGAPRLTTRLFAQRVGGTDE